MVTLPQPCGPSALWTWSWAFPDGNVAVEALDGFFTALVPFKSRAIISGTSCLAFLGYKVLLTQEVMRGIQGVNTQVRRPEQMLGEHASLSPCVPSLLVSLRLLSGLICP